MEEYTLFLEDSEVKEFTDYSKIFGVYGEYLYINYRDSSVVHFAEAEFPQPLYAIWNPEPCELIIYRKG